MTFRSRREQTCGLVRRHAANNNTRNDSRNAVLLVPFITGRRPPTSSSLLAWRRQRRARPDYEKRLEGARAIASATAEQHSLLWTGRRILEARGAENQTSSTAHVLSCNSCGAPLEFFSFTGFFQDAFFFSNEIVDKSPFHAQTLVKIMLEFFTKPDIHENRARGYPCIFKLDETYRAIVKLFSPNL